MTEPTTAADAASSYASLALVARFHGLPADPAQLSHEFGTETATRTDMVRAARHIGLKARTVHSTTDKLDGIALPALACTNDGDWFVIARVADDKVLIHDPAAGRPLTLSHAELNERWSGELVLVTRRARLTDAARKFDISWFIPAIVKYRSLLGEVLIASFFLQLFALVTPLFFQVVVDKVLVHKGLSTLDVLCIGLLVLSLFEVVLSGLRTYVFSHTTNRIDVTKCPVQLIR